MIRTKSALFLALLVSLLLVAPSLAEAGPAKIADLANIPSGDIVSNERNGNDLIFVVSGQSITFRVEKIIVNNLEAKVPDGFVTSVNRISERKQKFGYSYDYALPSDASLGVILSANASSSIVTNGTGIKSDYYDVDFSVEIANGFEIEVTKELENSARIVMKKSFSAGDNRVDIDPVIVGTTSSSDFFQYNFFQNRIARVNDTWFVFFIKNTGTSTEVNYVSSFDGLTWSSEQAGMTDPGGVNSATDFNIDYNETNVSVFYRDGQGRMAYNVTHTQGLTLVGGNGSVQGHSISGGSGQITHAFFDNGNAAIGWGSDFRFVNLTNGVLTWANTGTYQNLNSSYSGTGGAPVTVKLNSTSSFTCYPNRFGVSGFDFSLHCGFTSPNNYSVYNVQTYASDTEFNSTLRPIYFEKTKELVIPYSNQSTQTVSFKRRNNDSTITPAAVFSIDQSFPNPQDSGNWQGRNVTCSGDNVTLTIVCFKANGTGVYVGNMSLDFSTSNDWGKWIDKTGNLTSIVSTPYAIDGKIGVAWQEQTGIFFDVWTSNDITPPEPEFNEFSSIWNNNTQSVFLNRSFDSLHLNVSTANITTLIGTLTAQTIRPSSSLLYTLGSASAIWLNIYTQDLNVTGTVNATNVTSHDGNFSGKVIGAQIFENSNRFPQTYSCPPGQFAISRLANGTEVCGTISATPDIMGFSGASAVIEKGTTDFIGVGTGVVRSNESNAEFYIPISGTVKNLRTYVSMSDTNNPDTVIMIRKNGADTTLDVNYGTSEAGLKSDTSNTFTVVPGDRISIQVNNSATGEGHKDFVVESVSVEISS